MKNSIIILLSITSIFFSCGSDEKKPPKKKVLPVSTIKPISEKITKTASIDTVAITQNLRKKSKTDKKSIFAVKEEIDIKPQIQSPQITTEHQKLDVSKEANKTLMTFVNLRKILYGSKVGQTLTQKQLTQNFEIPEEAVKLVKSITKTAEDEIAVKWHSTWLVEKLSDAKFKDGFMKITFKANKLYTSGTAIGIKYDKKIYNNLIIVGRSAYIPSVKGYSWQIGK
ncbi:hypothetical protein [Flavobacterium sp. KJJ]|uniref:hypothetical protein n=1 Tax=Flavobacterium sp. KJJ TaxID=1270193 RepID=UPI0004933A30|nr:hypothetical protein [Flavobacterium sp. KJJ]